MDAVPVSPLRRLLQTLFGGLLIALAWDEAGLGSIAEIAIPVLGCLAGAVVIGKALVFDGSRTGMLYRRRREIVIAAVSTTIFVLCATVAAAFIGMGPTRAYRRASGSGDPRNTGATADVTVSAQRQDDELGWAPAGPGLVGQRLHAIDRGRSRSSSWATRSSTGTAARRSNRVPLSRRKSPRLSSAERRRVRLFH